MSEPMIVASAKAGPGAVDETSARAWLMLGWIGAAFLTVGGFDFLLAWFPLNFGNRGWEFGTVTASLNGFPILLLGLGLLIVAAEQVGRRWWSLLGVAVTVVLLIWVLVGIGFWASNISLALATVPAELELGIRRSVYKTAVQAVVYPAILVYLLRRGWTKENLARD